MGGKEREDKGLCCGLAAAREFAPSTSSSRLAEVPGIDAGGSAGAEDIAPELSRGQQRPRDQCRVKEIRLRTRGFYSFLPQERLGFMDFW